MPRAKGGIGARQDAPWSPDVADRERLFADFCTFAKAQLASGDIDPMYPVLQRYYAKCELTPEQALWRTLLYVGWYHVGTAEKMWTRFPKPKRLEASDVMGLPTGIERRGFRGNALATQFINGVLDRAPGGSLALWVTGFGEGEVGWDTARAEIQAVRFGGTWASYKFADLMKNVHGRPLVASDIGVGGRGETAGPVPGMVRLTGMPWQVCAGDVYAQKHLLERAQQAGVPFSGLDQLETALCDFNSLCKGTYYVGHDIDSQMDHLREVKDARLWEAREVFPARYRGEKGGWVGVRKELKSRYRDSGEVLT